MLKLSKFINRITAKGKVKDIEQLRQMLPRYGDRGLYAVADVLNNPNLPEYVRADALVILGTERTQLPTGESWLMTILENLAESAPPDLDLICFVGVYANAIRGRVEAAGLVDRFKVGTDRQRAIFFNTDQQFLRGLAAREKALQVAAVLLQRQGVK